MINLMGVFFAQQLVHTEVANSKCRARECYALHCCNDFDCIKPDALISLEDIEFTFEFEVSGFKIALYRICACILHGF